MTFSITLYVTLLLSSKVCLQTTSWTIVPTYPTTRSRTALPWTIQEPSGSSSALSGMDFDDSMLSSAPLAVAVAIVVGVAAQTFINTMLQGEQGLGAFLKDGRGYNGSGFVPENRPVKHDPLPWLSLPQLGFVEVAGQESVTQQLERLRNEMTINLDQGLVEEATLVRQEMEEIMKEHGFEFTTDAT
jgi:hypothetical protein